MSLAHLFVFAIAYMGHLALWTRIHCMVHSLPWKKWVIDALEISIFAIAIFLPLVWAIWYLVWGWLLDWNEPRVWYLTPLVYLPLCWLCALLACVLWLSHRWDVYHAARYVRQVAETRHDFSDRHAEFLGGTLFQGANRLPGNEILRLCVNRRELVLPRLPEALDGWTITHLSDLHLTGQMTKAYYHQVIDQANQFESDCVMVAGDVYDKDHCIDWATDVLFRLQARAGVFFVFGNHDVRLHDVVAARRALVSAGWNDLGGAVQTAQWRGETVLLAGNESPWFAAPAEDHVPPVDDMFRILLAHTPDQIDWAHRHGFDLVLAGHNHGGQIRLPIAGPLVSPSRYGVRYAGGTFRRGETLMQVSRGVSGTNPLRWNCQPEITQLVLRRE
ncbi:MAG: metallophosphoesterase [Pirellulaceae bacterium]